MKRILMTCAMLVIAACKQEAATTEGGEGTTAPSPADSGAASAETATKTPEQPKAPPPPGCNSDFSEPITADVTLTEKCNPYTVKADLNVDGYTLTIDPGVVLNFESGAQLNIAYYKPARLLVKGTKEKPVKFTGRGWNGVRFYKEAAGSSVENAVIDGAGSAEQPSLKSETNDLTLSAITFTGGKKTALQLTVEQPLKGLSALDLTKASESPEELIHASVVTAGSFGPDSKFPAKGVIWLEGNLETEVTLVNPGVPFRVANEMNIDPQEGKSAGITLEEGVTIELAENAALSFGYYRGPSALKVEGTKEKPVTVTRYGADRAQTPSGGLKFFTGARPPELDFLVLEYAGGPDKGALSVSDSRGLGKITNSTFRHLPGEGIRVESSKERFEAFDNNTFEDVADSALRIPLELAHGLGANNKFTEKARVTLFGEAKKDTTLEDVGAPYQIEGELAVNGYESKTTALTIAPGSTLLFNDEGKLSVAYYAPAKLVAKGTAEKPITFGKMTSSWKGVAMHNKGVIELENAAFSGTDADTYPLELRDSVSGTVKKVALTDTKKGIRGCTKKVKPVETTADEGVKPIEKCK